MSTATPFVTPALGRRGLSMLLVLTLLGAGCVSPTAPWGGEDASSGDEAADLQTSSANETGELEKEKLVFNGTMVANAGVQDWSLLMNFQRIFEHRPENLSHLEIEMTWSTPSQLVGAGGMYMAAKDEAVTVNSTEGPSPLQITVTPEGYNGGDLWVGYGSNDRSVIVAADVTITVTVYTWV